MSGTAEYSSAIRLIGIREPGNDTRFSGSVLLFGSHSRHAGLCHMAQTTILDKIKCLRKKHGYSHEYMAERLHMSTSAYQRHESGDAKLELDWLQAVAKVLEIDLIELLRGESIVVNLRDQSGGTSGCNYGVHHNGELAEILKTLKQHHAVQLREQREFNARQMVVQERLIALLERLTGGNATL